MERDAVVSTFMCRRFFVVIISDAKNRIAPFAHITILISDQL